MAALTLLQAVQNALDAIGGDEVTGIADTPDAVQVAEICRDVYQELMSLNDWPHLYTYTSLTGIADADAPTYLTISDDVDRVEGLRYNVTETGDTDTTWSKVEWLEPECFLDMVLGRKTSNTNVIETNGVGGLGVTIPVYNDAFPSYWTTFDNTYLICDSYNAVEDPTGLDGAKCLAYTRSTTDFTTDDGSTVIPIPEYMQPLYLARVRAKAFVYLKQVASPQDEREANRQLIRSRRRGRARLNQTQSTYPKGRRT